MAGQYFEGIKQGVRGGLSEVGLVISSALGTRGAYRNISDDLSRDRCTTLELDRRLNKFGSPAVMGAGEVVPVSSTSAACIIELPKLPLHIQSRGELVTAEAGN